MSFSDLRAYSKLTNPASLLPILIRHSALPSASDIVKKKRSIGFFLSFRGRYCFAVGKRTIPLKKENRLDTISYLLPRRWRVKFRTENALTRFSEPRKKIVYIECPVAYAQGLLNSIV